MQLRFKKETKVGGLLILESEPQIRTKVMKSQLKASSRLVFPYVYFVIKYFKDKDGRFVYPGVYCEGLKVFFSLDSLKSFKNDIFYSPIDFEYKGFVCTSHSFDKSSFNSLEELVDQVICLWWGTEHKNEQHCSNWVHIDKIEDLKKIQLESAGVFHQTFQQVNPYLSDSTQYRDKISYYKKSVLNFLEISIEDDAEIYKIGKQKLIREPWKKKVTLDLSKILEEIALQKEEVVV